MHTRFEGLQKSVGYCVMAQLAIFWPGPFNNMVIKFYTKHLFELLQKSKLYYCDTLQRNKEWTKLSTIHIVNLMYWVGYKITFLLWMTLYLKLRNGMRAHCNFWNYCTMNCAKNNLSELYGTRWSIEKS